MHTAAAGGPDYDMICVGSSLDEERNWNGFLQAVRAI